MNWLDVVLLALLAFTVTAGWRRGLVRQFFDIVSVIVAYFLALRFGRDFVLILDGYVPIFRWLPNLLDSPRLFGLTLGDIIVRLIGFFIVYFLVRLAFHIVSGTMHAIFSLPLLGTVNAVGGMVLGAIKGLILVLILVAVFQLLGTPFWDRTLRESVLATIILDIWPVIYDQMVHFLLNAGS